MPRYGILEIELLRKTLFSFLFYVAFHLALAAVLFTVSTLASELSLKTALAFARKAFLAV